ncbi:ferrous iron transport protein B [Acinetobacter qingfengensis]|uniref:Ferrous iron transport protein B n=1 Tax=Acinetobacter qingfengensis TaxID=1262585 RepID=A0A1E7QYX9_9GAMM|nr:ferrous iron transport protein B [Acinetobacter qingfengensis]KAA8733120.1 ferrous iron transport protein B [Acinetobacter qingfengensis]OEY92269.1 ferrous iron transport protein B [Acinetobacter qingfengensis]
MSNEVLRIALVGNPNCGKTSLFNHLTGTKQKVANYAGVTVERKEGLFNLPSGQTVRVLDLPGTYSLDAASPDEAITRDVCQGVVKGEEYQDAFLCIVDATNLKLHLNLLLEVAALKRPMLIVLNMMDEARRRGIQLNPEALSQALGVPVVETVAVKQGGVTHLLKSLEQQQFRISSFEPSADLREDINHIFTQTVTSAVNDDKRTTFLDSIFLHPVFGLLTLAILMFIVFQAVFAWAAPFMDGIETFFSWLGESVGEYISQPLLQSLVVDGIIAGAGGVVVFLPQILILFFFILVLEESGYLPRAAFLLDKLMFKAGLSGRAFIPLLSSFACAIPGIMATRTISDPRDRFTTILVAPLMTCSARLPVYALLISAFIPQKMIAGVFNLQGLVLFALYMAGIVSALIISYIIKLFRKDKSEHSLLMELPSYRIPDARNILLGVYERGKIFMKRVGGIIFALSVLLWFLCTFPQPPENATLPDIDYSFAGMLGHLMQPLFAPIGFPWQICVALIPAMAAREVVVAALGTVYALSGDEDAQAQSLASLISSPDSGWSLATGLALLVWFIYAPHCLATLATVRRETGSWKSVIIMTLYLFGLAYIMAFFTYQIASRMFA